MDRYAIVIIAYNREKSLKRLLDSINRAEYAGDKIDVIISIDKSENEEVFHVAKRFEWQYGEKKIVKHESNLGLKKHILSCGEYVNFYKAIAVLEDDLIVSPSYYLYMKATAERYGENENIAGISLYSHQWNVVANAPFWPVPRDYDVFFMQFAQSWGQVWIKKQWNDFYEWYKENEDVFEKECEEYFPQSIRNWGKNSWLKYHIRYCVDKNKFFVYPYCSLTTNFTETGVHAKQEITRFHVPFESDVKNCYKLCDFDKQALRYDVFFENICLQEYLNKNYPGIVVDLYGTKELKKNEVYRITTQLLDKKVLTTFGLLLRPIEFNVGYEISGNGIYIYDMRKYQKNKFRANEQIVNKWNYFMKERFFMIDELIPVSFQKIKNFLKCLKK